MGDQTITEKLGSASEVENVNPYTGNVMNLLGNRGNQAFSTMGGFDPRNSIASLRGATPQIQDITGTLISPFGRSLNETSELLANNAMRSVANQYSDVGALNSGAALSAMTRGAAQPISEAATKIAGLQSQLGGNLASGYLGQLGSAYGTQANLLGQNLGLQSQLGKQEWWQPTYMQHNQPGLLSGLGGLMGAAGAGLGLIPGMGWAAPAGAAIGGGLGALGGIFGN